jgi:hypothetical protein
MITWSLSLSPLLTLPHLMLMYSRIKHTTLSYSSIPHPNLSFISTSHTLSIIYSKLISISCPSSFLSLILHPTAPYLSPSQHRTLPHILNVPHPPIFSLILLYPSTPFSSWYHVVVSGQQPWKTWWHAPVLRQNMPQNFLNHCIGIGKMNILWTLSSFHDMRMNEWSNYLSREIITTYKWVVCMNTTHSQCQTISM